MSYARIGLGAPPVGTAEVSTLMQKYGVDDGGYSDAVLGVFNKVASPEVVATLTPVIQMGVMVGKAAIDELSAVAGAATTSNPGFPAAVMGFVNEVSGLAASASSLAGQAASIVGDAIPIVSMAIQAFTGGVAVLQASKDAAYQQTMNLCDNPDPIYGRYLPVIGSARGNAQKPADIFVAGLATPGWGPWTAGETVTGPTGKIIVLKAAQFNPIPTDLGAAFIAVTEGDDGGSYRSRFGTPGPSPDTRALFRFIRKAIQASAKHPEITDGGASIWPLYLDLLRREFDNGNITVEYARYMWVLGSQKMSWDQRAPASDDMRFNTPDTNAEAARQGRYDLMTPWEAAALDATHSSTGYWECKKFDHRAFDALIQTVVNWRDNVNPKHLLWGSDIATFKAEQANLVKSARDIARQRLGLPPAGVVGPHIVVSPGLIACAKAKGTWNAKYNTCTTTRQGVKWDTKSLAFVPIAPPPLLVMKKPTSPLLALAFGVAVVGGIAWMAKRRRKRLAAA